MKMKIKINKYENKEDEEEEEEEKKRSYGVKNPNQLTSDIMYQHQIPASSRCVLCVLSKMKRNAVDND